MFKRKSKQPRPTTASAGDTGASSSATASSIDHRQRAPPNDADAADTQAVIDMMTRKHHAKHPHSKDVEGTSDVGQGSENITGSQHSRRGDDGDADIQVHQEYDDYEEDDDDDDLFKFNPPESDQGELHDQQHPVTPPQPVTQAMDPLSPATSSYHNPGATQRSAAALYAQEAYGYQVRLGTAHGEQRPSTAVSKRRAPYAYPGSPIYSTSNPSRQREDTPVIELADRMRDACSTAAASSHPPEYTSQLDDLTDINSLEDDYYPGKRSSQKSGHAGLRDGGVDIDGIDEYAMRELGKPYAYQNGIPRPDTGYTASRRPMTGNPSSRGGTAVSRAGLEADGRLVVMLDNGDKFSINGYDFSGIEGEEEDSPFPEVRASVSNIDDTEMPVLTFRSWSIGLFFVLVGGCLNFFFNVRFPSPLVSPVTVQVLSYPAGKFLAYVLPTSTIKTPSFLRTLLGFPETLSLNPGPFNIKEHAIIVIMANVTLTPAYALNLTLVLDKFYKQPKGIGFDFLIVLSTQIIGFSFAGLCRRYLVWPAAMVWPQNLVTCTLFNTFHAEDDDGSDGSLTRFRYFSYVLAFAFFWFALPGYLFTALSVFSFMCWIFPTSAVVNQLFGISTGLGMSGITFDWAQIAYIGSPLVTPWFAAVNIFVGFFVIYWVLVPIFYYTNVWNFSYMPISVSGNFDRFGQYYNISLVTNADMSFNETLYREYSPLFMSTTYATVYGISFCLATASICHIVLYNGKEILARFRNLAADDEDVHMKLMRNYPEVADWWYWLVFLICITLAIIAVEVYETGLTVWALLLSLIIPAVYIIPGGYIFALTAQVLTVNLLSEVIPGYAIPGKPVANMIFKAFSVQALQAALYFVQDLKVGHYMKIPPRATFIAQMVGILVACVSQVGMKKAMEALVPDICTDDQRALLVCPISHVAFEASVIWGLIGPERFFGHGTPYRPLLYLLLLGVFLPIPFYLAAKKWPNHWTSLINVPVMLNGATWIPPATGINYSSWFIVSFIFQFLLRRRRFRWWSKFNFITSCAMEAGTVLSALFIFFALQLPKDGNIAVKWWGNEVYKRTVDWIGAPYRTPPESGFGPASWD